MKDRYTFPAIFNYADDGISVYFPDISGCFTYGDTTEEAIKNAKEALGLNIFSMEEENESIPEPSAINDLKLEDNQAPILIDVYMPAVRPFVETVYTNKTVSLPAWLASRADERGVDYSQIFKAALIDYLNTNE